MTEVVLQRPEMSPDDVEKTQDDDVARLALARSRHIGSPAVIHRHGAPPDPERD